MKTLTPRIENKIKRIVTFVDIINYYYDEHPDGLNDNKEFWDIFHEYVTPLSEDWVIDTEEILHEHFSPYFQKFPYVNIGTEHLKKSILLGNPLTKPDVPSKNRNTLRAWFNIRDVVNDISGYEPPKKPKPPSDDPFDNLFDRT